VEVGRGSVKDWSRVQGLVEVQFFFFLSEVMLLLLAESKALPSHTGTSRHIQMAVPWYAPTLLPPDTVSHFFSHVQDGEAVTLPDKWGIR
jgi:hypothetical protein